MNNFIKQGNTLTLTAPVGGVVAGGVYLVGSLVVVAVTSAAAGTPFEGDAAGVFTLPKAAGAAWTEGATLYFDSANSNFVTAASATARRCGNAAAAAASGDTSGQVRLNNLGAPVNVA